MPLILWALLCLWVGCSAPSDAPSARTAKTALEAVATSPWASLVKRGHGLSRDADGRWRLDPKRSPSAGPWTGSAPPRADGAFRIEAGTDWLEVAPRERSGDLAVPTGNTLVYPQGALGGQADVAVSLLPDRVEELVVLFEAPPSNAVHLSYDVILGPGVTFEAPAADATPLVFVDHLGRRFARLAPPVAADERGAMRALTMTHRARDGAVEVDLSLDLDGLALPVVIDPAWQYGARFPQEEIVAFEAVRCVECDSIFGDVAVVATSGEVEIGTADYSVLTENIEAAFVQLGGQAEVNGDIVTATGGLDQDPGASRNGSATTGTFPSTVSVPTFPSFVPGTNNLAFSGSDDEMQPGTYGDVEIEDARVELKPGVYNVNSLTIRAGGELHCDADPSLLGCEVRVNTMVDVEDDGVLMLKMTLRRPSLFVAMRERSPFAPVPMVLPSRVPSTMCRSSYSRAI